MGTSCPSAALCPRRSGGGEPQTWPAHANPSLLSGPARGACGFLSFPSCLGHQIALPTCLPLAVAGQDSRAELTLLGSTEVGLASAGPRPPSESQSPAVKTGPTTYTLRVTPGSTEGSAGTGVPDRKGIGSRLALWPGPRVNKPQSQTPEERTCRLRETLCQDGEEETFITYVNCCHPRLLPPRSLPRALSRPCSLCPQGVWHPPLCPSAVPHGGGAGAPGLSFSLPSLCCSSHGPLQAPAT